MQDFIDKALILRVGRFREADLWLRLFTPQRGLLTAFAFGGSRSRRRFVGCLDALNVVSFLFQPNKTGTYLALGEGDLLKGRRGLRKSSKRLGFAANCVKFFEAVHVEPEESEKSFVLLDQALDTIESEDRISPLFPMLFRLRTAFEQGYGPSLDTCSQCGKVLKTAVAPTLFVEEGRILCGECSSAGGRRVPLNGRVLSILEHVCRNTPKAWCSLELAGEDRRIIYDAVDSLVRWHLGLKWEDGRFLRT
ncbi:DNA repair protein RecO [Desulfobaculum bizertense]|uniref:DNA repair protein RecO n=1 Tax=Desulfobaculum bizertense TaxID=376490 RepID=UPI001F42752D|nr:DNA repair protein RecO [Desulfobaculum bizertense]UIJ38800.1 DNA repair protein RecO [Desulfobaculum bizertense]